MAPIKIVDSFFSFEDVMCICVSHALSVDWEKTARTIKSKPALAAPMLTHAYNTRDFSINVYYLHKINNDASTF